MRWRQERAEAQTRYDTQALALATEQARLADKAQQWQAVTDELSAARSLIEGEALQRRKLASRIIELERAEAELTEQLNTGCVSHATQLATPGPIAGGRPRGAIARVLRTVGRENRSGAVLEIARS